MLTENILSQIKKFENNNCDILLKYYFITIVSLEIKLIIINFKNFD